MYTECIFGLTIVVKHFKTFSLKKFDVAPTQISLALHYSRRKFYYQHNIYILILIFYALQLKKLPSF